MPVTPFLEHSHDPHEIERRLREGPRISYLRDWVYGGIDGTVTTFAIVAGAVGADLSNRYLWIALGAFLWLGFIGFLDDLLKLRRQNSNGLLAITKLSGQILLGDRAA